MKKDTLFFLAMISAIAAITFTPDSVTPATVRALGSLLILLIGWMGFFTNYR